MKSSRFANWTELAGPKAFLRDKAPFLALSAITGVLGALFLVALKVSDIAMMFIAAVFCGYVVVALLIEYWRRRNFYRALLVNLVQLDQSYLILETVEEPNFYDGKILYDTLYTTNKSMGENIKKYRDESRNFREYIELWVHEVKTPLAALSLMVRDPKAVAELRRLDNLVDQVLYFSRAENAERDYLIGEVMLAKIVHEVALRNQSLFLGKHVELATKNLDYKVHTDAKWVEFILGQIIHNSVKYNSRKVIISAEQHGPEVILAVEDDGIGIDPKDLPRIFEKSFTGQNGRLARGESESSTGMGLYIVKTLCRKLGHRIEASSVPGKGTIIKITFSDHDYYLTKK